MLKVAPNIVRRDVRENGLHGTIFRPDGSGSHPAVLVLGGSEGGHPESAALALAREGFCAMSLLYFGPQLGRELIEVPLEYFAHGIRFLLSQDGIDGDRVAVIGSSKGGEAALLLAATYPHLVSAVVGYVPSSVVYQGISFNPFFSMMPKPSSWTLSGKYGPFVDGWTLPIDLIEWRKVTLPVWPHYTRTLLPMYPISLIKSYERPLDRGGNALRRATIPVEDIDAPVLLISGAKDKLWPATRLSEMAMDRLRKFDHPHEYRHLVYEEAGHLIALPGYESLNPDFLDFGGNRKADIAAGRDAWRKVVEFAGDNVATRRLR